MAAAMEPAKERLERHLRDAYSRDDSEQIAFWTNALKSWERPIPGYARSELNEFSLEQRAAGNTDESVHGRDIDKSFFGSKIGRY